jgi:hypothetical protein
MNKCICCKELISPSTMSYKISSGFIDPDHNFNEDLSIVVHVDCTHLLNPFSTIEDLMKES